MSIPYEEYKNFGPGKYKIDLITEYFDGEMLVADHRIKGKAKKLLF